MNVLLINPPLRLHTPPYYHPMGLAILAKVLQNGGHEVEIYDLNCLRYDYAEAIENLPKGDWGLIGVSGIITTYKYLNFLIPALRETYDAPIVLGGGGFTSGYETYMERLRPDYGVIGEGEYTLLELVEAIATGGNTDDILGITYYKDDELIVNPPRPLEMNLDNFPMMAFDLLDMETYITNVRHNINVKREAGMIATRGCPMNCVYCYHVFGKGVRYRSVEGVIEEMEYLIENYQVESFLFGDECFTARRKWIEEFCNTLIDKQIKVEWSCFSRVDTIKEGTMQLMKEAGCFFMGFGFESGSQKILDEMDKRVTVEKARATAAIAEKYFRIVSGTFMFGMPGESDETIEDNIRFNTSVMFPRPYFFVAPYPGTQIYFDNMDKILAAHGNLHNFFIALGDKDAGHFIVNLTRWSDLDAVKKKTNMDRHIKFAIGIRQLFTYAGNLIASEDEIDFILGDSVDDAIFHSLSTNRATRLYMGGKKYDVMPRDIRELVRATEKDENINTN